MFFLPLRFSTTSCWPSARLVSSWKKTTSPESHSSWSRRGITRGSSVRIRTSGYVSSAGAVGPQRQARVPAAAVPDSGGGGGGCPWQGFVGTQPEVSEKGCQCGGKWGPVNPAVLVPGPGGTRPLSGNKIAIEVALKKNLLEPQQRTAIVKGAVKWSDLGRPRGVGGWKVALRARPGAGEEVRGGG